MSISEKFGTPEDVANNFLSEMNVRSINETNKYIMRGIHLFVAIAMVLSAVIFGVEIHKMYVQHKLSNIYFIESVTYEGEHIIDSSEPTYAVTEFENMVNEK